jgi:hypothetical protein
MIFPPKKATILCQNAAFCGENWSSNNVGIKTWTDIKIKIWPKL